MTAYKALLESHGYRVVHQSFYDEHYIKLRYSGASRFRLLLAAARCTTLRLSKCFFWCFQRPYDVLWVQSEAFPYFPYVFELLAHCRHHQVVYDFDDAIHVRLMNRSLVSAISGGKFFKLAKSRRRIAVSVGNSFLQGWARDCGFTNVYLIPSLVPDSEVKTREVKSPPVPCEKDTKQARPAVVGWLGSPTTAPYLRELLDAYATRETPSNFVFSICGASQEFVNAYEKTHKDLRFIDWSLEAELQFLDSLDVGIMPLKNSEWEEGKCGYKLIRYMSRGIPFLATRTGANAEIAADGAGVCLDDGLSGDAWLEQIDRFVDELPRHPDYRDKGPGVVKDKYTYEARLPQLLEIFGEPR